jgi:hypothetical protein
MTYYLVISDVASKSTSFVVEGALDGAIVGCGGAAVLVGADGFVDSRISRAFKANARLRSASARALPGNGVNECLDGDAWCSISYIVVAGFTGGHR